jgi:hypothetical protein|tara:strand:- start:665 stop:862 length:198 start_codon:yes stop_codon:yes gene_type:complete
MTRGLIDISFNKDAFAIRILNIFKFQFAKDNEWSTVTFRVGVWRFFTSISFTYSSNKSFERHGIS